MNNLLEISHICKNYIMESEELKAIEDITLNIEKGSIVTIIGSSGCGKSSLLSILAGIDEKTEGNVLFHIENPTIGYMLQSDCLFPWLTIYENCLLGLKIQKKDTEENKNYIMKLLKSYKLDDFKDKYPHELSGGMKQRVG